MAFERFKRIFRGKTTKKLAQPRIPQAAPAPAQKSSARQKKIPKKRHYWYSPYTGNSALQKQAMQTIRDEIRKSPESYRTDKFLLLEIADQILEKKLQLPRPPQLRAHDIFFMFTEEKQRKGVSGTCLVWQGATKSQVPILTTFNAQEQKKLNVDARVYIIENPPRGARRRLRSIPQNTCGNPLCVNSRHIRMVPKNPQSHQGENHPRAKFSDQVIRKMVLDYNAGMTSREVAEKYGIHWTYVEQIMRKEKRTAATQGLKIRGRFSAH